LNSLILLRSQNVHKVVGIVYRVKFPHVVYGNPLSPVAVLVIYPYAYPMKGYDVTKEDLEKYEEYMRYCKEFVAYGAAIAGLQNTEFGTYFVCETLLYNPNIRWLIVVGKSKGHRVGEIYRLLAQRRLSDPRLEVIGRRRLERLLKQVSIIDMTEMDVEDDDVRDLVKYIISCCLQEPENARTITLKGKTYTLYDRGAFEEAVIRSLSYDLVVLGDAIVVRVDEAWKAYYALNDVMSRYGEELHERDRNTRRIVLPFLALIIEKPSEWGDEDLEPLETYYKHEFMRAELGDNESYTYGERIFRHFGLNQLEVAIEKLKNAIGGFTTRAHVAFFNPAIDHRADEVPCLTEIHLQIRRNVLNLRASFRSWDIVHASKFNIYALSRLMEDICEETKLRVGELFIICDEPHVYAQ